MTKYLVQTSKREKKVVQQNSQLLQEPKISHRMEKKALGISSPFSPPLHSGYSNLLNFYSSTFFKKEWKPSRENPFIFLPSYKLAGPSSQM